MTRSTHRPLTFKDLPVGARFSFVGDYGDDYDWNYSIKTGPRTYRERTWGDGSGGDEGRVGVGDNPVIHKVEETDGAEA